VRVRESKSEKENEKERMSGKKRQCERRNTRLRENEIETERD